VDSIDGNKTMREINRQFFTGVLMH